MAGLAALGAHARAATVSGWSPSRYPGSASCSGGPGASAVWSAFWRWYERHYALNVSIAACLFVLQLLHLYWLAADVIAVRLAGESYWDPSEAVQYAIYVIDYTEIPALVSVSLVYVNELRKGFALAPVLMLLFLDSQWLHIFWITDELVVNEFAGEPAESTLPAWLAWVAILIDYLELPVIYDTIKRMIGALRDRRVGDALAALRED
jgi:hypothetical protein